MNEGERKALCQRRIAVNDCRRKEGTKKPPLKHHCNNCCKQDLPGDAKLVGRYLRRYRVFAQLYLSQDSY